MEKSQHVSSRRGRNFLLHSLEENDVVFGTKGNGRNEIFLKVLESHSEQYMRLSKFQKMGLIQKIIRNWNGNFYIMNSKTNDLCLAKEKDQDLSTTEPSSRKLYTSVRRMMNYVNSKAQRQPHYQQRNESTQQSAVTPRTVTGGSITATKNEHGQNARKEATGSGAEISDLSAKKKNTLVTSTAKYVCKNQISLPVPSGNSLLSLPCTSNSMNILSPERSAMLVTPEPSPRAIFQKRSSVGTSQFPKIDLSQNNTAQVAPSLPLPTFSSTNATHKNRAKDSYSKQQEIDTYFNDRNKDVKKNPHSANNFIGDLEESAILALTSLGSSSSSINSR